MIFGIGNDLVQIDRLQKSLTSPAFWQRVYGEEERAFLQKLHSSRQLASAAANFAAKEAFLKAVGTGIGGFALCEIQTLRQQSGAPAMAFCGEAQAFMQQKGLIAHVSLTHEAGLAGAFVVLEQRLDV